MYTFFSRLHHSENDEQHRYRHAALEECHLMYHSFLECNCKLHNYYELIHQPSSWFTHYNTLLQSIISFFNAVLLHAHKEATALLQKRTNRIMSVQETKLEQEVLIFLFIIHTGGLGVPALKSAKDARVNQCHPLWITTATLINIWGLSTTIHSTFEM